MSALSTIGRHLRLSGALFWRHGAPLTALWAAGQLLNQLLLRGAAELGSLSRLAGLIALSPVILLQLLIFVAMFVILRRDRPSRAGPPVAEEEATDETGAGNAFAALLLAALIPFYGYYAGWGLLGDTLRNYSQLFYQMQVARIDYDNPAPMPSALDIGRTAWVVMAVVLIWAIRRLAKAMHKRGGNAAWAAVVVACEATWALLGLYVISGWSDAFAAWLAALPSPGALLDWLVAPASAAITAAAERPVDWPPAFQPWAAAQRLFWYALLPLVWFNLGAIVSGHDLAATTGRTRRVAGRAIDRWQALPKPLTDFIGHFWAEVVKRWHAVANGVMLAASAGFALTVSVLVAWRLVDYLGRWAWVGAAQLIGPRDMQTWQLASVMLDRLFGQPGGPAGGLLVSPLQFCILAAALQIAARGRDAAEPSVPSAAPA